jgi:lipopolysaccharide export system permease protein
MRNSFRLFCYFIAGRLTKSGLASPVESGTFAPNRKSLWRAQQMKTLHKYLTGQVFVSLLLTVTVFTFVLLVGDALKEILPLLINGHARFGTVLEVIGLLIPFIWVFALPMGFLTATLLVFGRFSADQELTAARASGVSLISLIAPVLLLSLLFCGFCAWINMEIGPQSRVACVNLIYQLRANLVNGELPEGRFINISTNYIFYTEKNRGGELENVTVLWLDNDTTIQAPRGEIEMYATNKQLVLNLFDARSVTIRKNGDAALSSFGKFPITVDLDTAINKTYTPSISDMTFGQLRDELRDLNQKLSLPPDAATNSDQLRAQLNEIRKQRGDLTEPVRVEMNRQIAFSFACFGFALVGIPLGIRVHRRETNIGFAIALGLAAIYFSFLILGKALSSHTELAPHLIVWLPNFIFQAVGAVLLWRANRGI